MIFLENDFIQLKQIIILIFAKKLVISKNKYSVNSK